MSARLIMRLAVASAYVALAWIAGLACIAVGIYRVGCFLIRLRAALRPTIRCPEGHETSVYGRWRCGSCRALFDGWAFRCPVCGPNGWAGHVTCEQCGLTATSPLVRED